MSSMRWPARPDGDGMGENGRHMVEQLSVSASGVQVIGANLLAGGNSVMVLTDDGAASQWFSVRNEQGLRFLSRIRSFDNLGAVQALVPESSRKGFLTAGSDGTVAVFHATAHRLLMREVVAGAAIIGLAVAPRANAFWALDEAGMLHFWRIHNEHPEISWSSLWS